MLDTLVICKLENQLSAAQSKTFLAQIRIKINPRRSTDALIRIICVLLQRRKSSTCGKDIWNVHGFHHRKSLTEILTTTTYELIDLRNI